MAAVPMGPTGDLEAFVDADTAVIPATTKHPEEAWEVMKWFYDPEIYDRLIANYGCLPADTTSITVWQDNMSAKYPGVDFDVLLDAMDYVEDVNHESWKPNYGRVNAVLDRVRDEIRAGTTLDVEAALQAADGEVQQILDEYWAMNP
jgi:ABC-type glycerol-3-phosphate transport system substrate-binding protein